MEINMNKGENVSLNNSLNKKKYRVNWPLFVPPLSMLIIMIVWGFVSNETFSKCIIAVKTWIMHNFSGFFILVVFALVVTAIAVAISPAGKIKLGGKDAVAEFSFLRYFAMTLCGGIAIGIVFWGVAEPVTFYGNPPASWGVDPSSPESAVMGMSKAYLHWTFFSYATFTVWAIAIGYNTYNKNRPLAISNALYPVLGDKVDGPIGKVVDAIGIFGIIAANIPSLVFATMQISKGLNIQYNIPNSMVTWVILIAFITLCFTAASYSGVKKGIAIVSDGNFWVYMVLLAFIIIAGPTLFITNFGIESIGAFIGDIVPSGLFTDAFSQDDGWIGSWTGFYWCWFLAGAPITATFIVKISKGRTLRQMIFVNLFCCGLFCLIWFTLMGGTAIYQDYTGVADIYNLIQTEGNEVALFAFFKSLPLSDIVIPIAIIAMLASFITLANMMTTTVSTLTSKNLDIENDDDEPPAKMKLLWGILIGCGALVIMMAGAMDAIQTTAVMFGFPLGIIAVFMIIGIFKSLFGNKVKKELKEYEDD